MELVVEITHEVLCVITKIRGQVGLTILRQSKLHVKDSGLGGPHIGP